MVALSAGLPKGRGMTVYALMEWVAYEGSYLYGVYSTEEKAQAAIEQMPRGTRRKDCKVHPVELDAAPDYVTN